MTRFGALALAFTVGMAGPARAVTVGRATGTVTIDGTSKPLAFAVQTRKDNLFDAKRQDTVFVLTDRPLGATKPDDEIELSMRSRRGELVVVTVRMDGATLVNVSVSEKGSSGLVILPGPWFQYATTKAGEATLKMATREFEGHSYAVDAQFAAAPYAPRRPTPSPGPAPPATRSR